MALSPDGSTVYFTRTSRGITSIYRIGSTGGQASRLATGTDPAVSPDSSELAYAGPGGQAIVVENLAKHTTRRLDLKTLIGPNASFENTPSFITWLSNTTIVGIPAVDGSAATAPAGPAHATLVSSGGCKTVSSCSELGAIVIELDAVHSANVVGLHQSGRFAGPIAVGLGAGSGSLLLGSIGGLIRFQVSATSAVRLGTISVPGDGMVAGFSPDGRHVLYLHNHGPVQLWSGAIGADRVTPTKELLANALLGSVSW